MSAPHSTQAEQAVLGSLLMSAAAIVDVADVLEPEDFYRADHQTIYAAIMELDRSGKAADLVTVSELLTDKGELESVGGLAYLGQIAQNAATSLPRHYAEIVRDKALSRRLIETGQKIIAIANSSGPAEEQMDEAQRLVLGVEARGKQGPVQIGEFASDWVDALTNRYYTKEGEIVGLPTGFTDLDELTQGLTGGDLVIVAGRPSMGKTTFAMNIAEHVAIGGMPVLVFSLEMPWSQLYDRSVASIGRVSLQRIRSGKLLDEEWPRATMASSKIKDAPLYVDDQGGLSITEMRARARRLKRQSDIGLIVVDYLQLATAEGENRTNTIGAISRGLKQMAKDLNVPVVALSQLNRALEQRADKRPVMSDLRESGDIEQDADLILFVYRDEVYNEESPDKGTAEIIIGKHRNGPLGRVRLAFIGEYTRFDDLDHATHQLLRERRAEAERVASVTVGRGAFDEF